MFVKIIFKEWRENILVFVLALLLFVLLIGLNLSDQPEMNLYYSGMFLLLFLPMASALIGSGAFNSEFKDNAWVYLLSRPISRKKIFIYKYLSQLSIIGVIISIFILVGSSLPRLKQIIPDINVGGSFNMGFATLPFYFVIPLLIFSLAFSLSILYEKQFVLVFAAIFIGAGFCYLGLLYSRFVLLYYSHWGSLRALPVFITFSFLVASFMTFIKSDFSQLKPKLLCFIKYLALFLCLSFAIQTVWIGKGKVFTGKKTLETFYSTVHQSDIFIPTYFRGLLKYDYETGKMERLPLSIAVSFNNFSFGGDNIAFFKQVRTKSRRWHQDLWIMNTDGANPQVLLQSSDPDSPFYKKNISNHCLLSKDGKQVVFNTENHSREPLETQVVVWWMNTDGSRSQKQKFTMPGNYQGLSLLAWNRDEKWVVMGAAERSVSNRHITNTIIKLDLRSSAHECILENIAEFYTVSVTSDQTYIAARVREPDLGQIVVLDLNEGETKVVFETTAYLGRKARWDGKGENLLISQPGKLLVYNVFTDDLHEVYIDPDPAGGLSFDWAADRIVILESIPASGVSIRVLSFLPKDSRNIEIPGSIKNPKAIWGTKDRILLENKSGALWSLDLNSEEWKKVY